MVTVALALSAVASHGVDYVVSNTNDSGAGSLRDALTSAVGSDSDDTITFSLPADSVIAPMTPLPALNPQDVDKAIRIQANRDVILDGSNLGGTAPGLDLLTNNDEIIGLVIINFPGDGVRIAGNNNRVANCWIGTDNSSTQGNGGHGIHVVSGSGNIIGYDVVNEDNPNIISGNDASGIYIAAGASETQVADNRIGLRPDGSTIAGNKFHGIVCDGTNDVIGGSSPTFRNIISGNMRHGIVLGDQSPSSGTAIQGNYIGLTPAGTDTRPNGQTGIVCDGSGVVIGGDLAGSGNVISANGVFGIEVTGYHDPGVTIQNNLVGTSPTGNLALGNTLTGIVVAETGGNVLIGGRRTTVGNIVSGNGSGGINIQGPDCTVQGNLVGVQSDGMTPLGNTGTGVRVSAANVLVGGQNVAFSNIISGNSTLGVALNDGAECTVRRNLIFDNAGIGIDVTVGGNGDIARPGMSTAWPVTGTALPNSIVDIYVDTDTGSQFVEGRSWEGTTTADGDGFFSISLDLSADQGDRLTATATGPQGTSEFALGILIPQADPLSPTPMEAEAASEMLFDFVTLDANESGSLSFAETESFIADLFQLKGGATAQDIFDGIDANGGGSLFVGELRQAAGELPMHAADLNGDLTLGFNELLRVIQLYNAETYTCVNNETASEDGYQPDEDGRTSCRQHSSDTDGEDFVISLSELLRAIQLYQFEGYRYCPDSPSEDTFCPALAL
jgi:parallel beta-helix repeat protein